MEIDRALDHAPRSSWRILAAALVIQAAAGIGTAIAAPSTAVGSDTVAPGDTASIAVVFDNDGVQQELRVDVLFNEALFTPNLSLCNNQSFGGQTVTCFWKVNEFSQDAVRISVGAAGLGNPILPDGTIGTVRFVVSGSASPGTRTLTIANEIYERCTILRKDAGGKGGCLTTPASGSSNGSITVLNPANTVPSVSNGGNIEFDLCPGDSDSFDIDFTETGGDVDGAVDCSLVTGTAFSIDPSSLAVPAGTTRTIRIETTAAGDGELAVDQLDCLLDDGTDYSIDLIQNSAATPSTISVADVSVDELDSGSRLARFDVQLGVGTGCPFTVQASTAPGSADASDFNSASSTLNFAGNEDEVQQLEVAILGDQIVEPDEDFSIVLSDLSANFVTVTGGSGRGIIRNDDSATITVGDAETLEGVEGDTELEFIATLDAAVQGGVDVDFRTEDGTARADDRDYVEDGGTLFFAGNAGEEQAFVISVSGDEVVELDEAFRVLLHEPNVADVSAGGGAIGTILNDDEAFLSVADAEASENDGPLAFPFRLDRPVDVEVSVDFETVDGTATVLDGDYEATSGTVTFPSGATEAGPVEVALVNDDLAELVEAMTLQLSMLMADGRTVGLADTEATGTIGDDDLARLLQLPIVDLQPADRAGTSVSVHGTSAVVGVPGANGEAGVVLIFDFATGQPELVATIPSPEGAMPGFGNSVSMEGELVLVGTEGAPAAKGIDSTALTAALFQRAAGGFQQVAEIKASQALGGGQVSLGFGLAFVGSPIDASVSVFEVGPAGAVPFGPPIFGPPMPKGESSGFGTSVAAIDNKLAIGAPGVIGGATAGSVSLFGLIAGNLQPVGTIAGTAPAAGAGFGASVAISGSTMAIGAPGGDGGTGFVELFSFPPAGQGAITPLLQIPAPAAAAGGAFGTSVAVDGDAVFVGAPGAAGNGAMFAFALDQLVQSYFAPPGTAAFGASVSAFDGSFAVGAPQTNAAEGAAFISPSVLFSDSFEGDDEPAR